MTVPTASRSQRWKVLRRSTTFWVGLGITGFWVLMAFFGELPEDTRNTRVRVLDVVDGVVVRLRVGDVQIEVEVLNV